MTEQAVSILARHPWVEAAWWDQGRNAVLVRPAAAAVAVRPVPGPLLTEHLEHWRHVYEYVYATAQGRHGDDLDLSGWRASDTGKPFPREHMIEWIEHAVALILRDKPRVVIELGCGSGLLAHRVHRSTRAYVGIDVAEPAVQRLRAQALPGVRVLQGAAHELTSPAVTTALREATDDDAAAPDCVVLNSVTQCFPNEQYLTAVLDDALDLVAPGGTVVVGDIRNLANAKGFARWLETARNPESTEPQLAARAADRLAADEELLCDPRLFARIADRHRRDIRTTCYAKPLREDTELTRYRYDIVYTVDVPAPETARTIEWPELTAERLRDANLTREPTLVTGIPNALLDPHAPDAIHPAELAAALPPSWAVLLDSADGHLLAVGPPELYRDRDAVRDNDSTVGSNDPNTTFVQRRLPEILTDYLERELPTAATPDIAVAQEPTVP
ncbi:class I SAM-dependent methyltransferase [Nocardia pseudovaccinii]|uniref:class I SAM-dependent methyltransferase n=1 Tax=Nocardia pseudovaccinii TaxID=189540 RepID=UPI0007C7BC0E|nr:class I SAM-dependent methyltransferase [Nocardia pseudovaccinii]